MNPAINTATFSPTTNAATRDGVIEGKDIRYVFTTGRKPDSPNPATSNPAWVIAPSPKKIAMLPKMTTAQLVHSTSFRHAPQLANPPKPLPPPPHLNKVSAPHRLTSA